MCGTFRKLPPSSLGEQTLYLLTDDREGTGTQAMRLADWAEDAEAVKRDLEDKANAKTAKQNPLSHLRFASNDRFALAQEQADTAEDAWRRQE